MRNLGATLDFTLALERMLADLVARMDDPLSSSGGEDGKSGLGESRKLAPTFTGVIGRSACSVIVRS